MTSTFTAPAGRGRHRRGRPGLRPVSTFVTVVRRGFFAAWFRPGKHRFEYPATASRPVVRQVAAV